MDQYRGKIIMWQKMAKQKGEFFVFDTETTGIPGKDPIVDIIEFSAIKVSIKKSGLMVTDSLDLFINPGYLIPDKITELTGITQQKIDTEGVTQEQAQNQIHQFWGDLPVLCGYNSIQFDEPLISDLYQKTVGVSFFSAAHLDVLRMAKEKIPANNAKNRKPREVANHKLQTMADYFGVSNGIQFHAAIDDVKATFEVMKNLMVYYKTPEPLPKGEVPLTMDGFYVTHINSFKKSYKMNRIYVKNSLDAKIYYDVYKRMWYVGNTLPEDKVIPIVLHKAGVSGTSEFVHKYAATE